MHIFNEITKEIMSSKETDNVQIKIPLTEKEEWRAYAKLHGYSLTLTIRMAMKEKMKRDVIGEPIDMISKGMKLEKEISSLRNHIKKLEDENKHLKYSQKIVGESILWDIVDFMFPVSPDEQPPIWSIANLHEVLPRHPVEEINDALASHKDDFQYMQDKGWQLLNGLEYLN
jgi:hypothetical protein